MGNSKRERAAPSQFIIAVYGKKLEFTISGIIIKTIGPRVTPKLKMNRNSPSKINTVPASSSKRIIKNPKAMHPLVTTDTKVPACKINFLPYFAKRNELRTPATTC